ncbi:MAG: UDP-2,3-diacylglucosamine diphosphatase LpxI [Deltaproteobacteria bacterium]|nr:UDP-2,3-diacylglucosamine diphosphatase LpxI [Deltaproteobacteria bacterium]
MSSPHTIRLGLIAGNSRFPLIFAEAAQADGTELVVVAHEGETPPEIGALVPHLTWVHVGELGKIIATFKTAGVTQVVMAGGIHKSGALTHIQPDERGLAFISRLPSFQDDVILRGIAQELESEGLLVVESTRFLASLLPQPGVLTRTTPTEQQWQDIAFGFRAARDIGRWDIGQSVIVKRGAVLAVEGIEGTNAAIRRGGKLGGPGTVVVKVSKPQQDLRFDVPAVGPETITVMQEVGATVLALEAGKTLMIDKTALLQRADAGGIAIVALTADHAGETTLASAEFSLRTETL